MAHTLLKVSPEQLLKLCSDARYRIHEVKSASESLAQIMTQLNEAMDDSFIREVTSGVLHSIDHSNDQIDKAESMIIEITTKMDQIALAQSSCGNFTLF